MGKVIMNTGLMLIMRIIRIVTPHLIRVRTRDLSETQRCDEVVDPKVIERSTLWWRENEYTKIKRDRTLRWLGLNFRLKTDYRETFEDYIWRKATDIVKLTKEMSEKNLLPAINRESKIFEPGCNLGKNIYYLQQAYGCEVYGLDISKEVIEYTKRKYWRKRARYTFYVENALTTSVFDKFEDNFFDLVITKAHLQHIPRSQQKKQYIDNLKRIGKALLIWECSHPDRNQVALYYSGRHCLSWDHYDKEYGLIEYQPVCIKLPANEKIFYLKK